ncbi:DUF7344 domain-containing protein [Natrinema salsiterrestre]|uniref:DUF7344 domain-containing protein n=1 Tax=Natrinema salsiterrestre TaxID=2950540 RepID=A0A9Q4L496_9EURY|nr:hypothetical protein [Natrinema salsiterrestre]MDF9745046.1 hypothetical protein [Natrinema salsiterrestre]
MTPDNQQDLDDVYQSVANQRRRTVLTYLEEASDDAASLDQLVDHVVDQETHSPGPDRESVLIDLYHCQLPMLDEAGVIDFDSQTETVQYRGHREVERLFSPQKPDIHQR